LNWCFFTPRLLAFRPLLYPRPAALNQDDQNNDRQSPGNPLDDPRMILYWSVQKVHPDVSGDILANHGKTHSNFPFLPQLFGQ
jgi:hypothetical protein